MRLLKSRLLILAILLIAVGLWINAHRTIRSPHGSILISRHAIRGVWSKDGNTIFYWNGHNRIGSYDVVSGERKSYRLPFKEDEYDVSPLFDVSPDKKFALFILYDWSESKPVIAAIDLQNQRLKRLYETKGGLDYFYWIARDAIVFTEQPIPEDSKCPNNIYLLEPGKTKTQLLIKDVNYLYPTVDGSGFIYTDSNYRYFFYDLASRKSRAINIHGLNSFNSTISFLYISKDEAVYIIHSIQPFMLDKKDREKGYDYDNKHGVMEVIDLDTMKIRPGSLPIPKFTQGSKDFWPYDNTNPPLISPNKKMFFYGTYHMMTDKSRLAGLWLRKIPERTQKELFSR